jgi:hypothetical protein
MPVYIVTVKLPRNPTHDPAHKKTGECQFSPHCTDLTGQHHSFVAGAENEKILRRQLAHTTGCEHITRIEEMA